MSQPTTLRAQILSGKEYYQALLKAIPKAKQRIVLAAMLLLWGKKFDPIFQEMLAALERGVRVRVLIDVHTRLIVLHGLKGGAERRQRIAKTFDLLKELQKKGAEVYYFGKLGLQPFRGRCHIKVTVVDDDCFTFGGVNFVEDWLGSTDYMLHSRNTELGDCLEQLVERIGRSRPPLRDGEERLDRENSVLFDGGRPKHSLIYERACELTRQAERVYYVSQWVPSSRLAFALRETDSTLYCNRPEQMPVPHAWGQAFDQQKYRLHNSYTRNKHIHAKLMLFELPGGQRALLTGSNNFSYRGVAFGTQEVALQSTSRALWDQLRAFMEKNIA